MTIDELGEYGMERMDDEEIERFLSMQSMGVLGLPTEDEPYLIPLSYGFDGGSQLYFFYLVGEESRKADLSERADSASFLVYSAETAFHWRSVFLTGSLRELSQDEGETMTDDQTPTWRPKLIEAAGETERTRFWEFSIEEVAGIRHDAQPPGYPFYRRPEGDGSE
ncbi:pyridoxamine 5'-phosphate oxidase family protein [Natronoarchaeum rubrum]|uniref:pyridoxamine 5'-phosphate oxidase family protein n=1 Tax=Natronoarchaeum rubrum TaxID=755311 RepID=UPI002111F943|nr:pyridoxamine 5'-phosphate oxidase family protein [Natronoarchaeum rubrum]